VTLEWLLRFQRPGAVLALHDLPPLAEPVEAALFGLTEGRLRARRDDQARSVRAAARGLPPPPFRAGELVVGLGDSITSDAQSWFELIAARSPARHLNAAISGDTTADLRKRVFRLAGPPPDWVLVMAGTNDCQRHGDERLVSAAETARNIRALDAALRRSCRRVIWITPPPVDEASLGPELTARGVGFRNADVQAVAAALPAGAIDIRPGYEGWEDGLHPTPAGQRRIAERVLRALT
jgi:acyl-CoA thioesterase I